MEKKKEGKKEKKKKREKGEEEKKRGGGGTPAKIGGEKKRWLSKHRFIYFFSNILVQIKKIEKMKFMVILLKIT